MITTIAEAVFTLSKLAAIAPFWKPELTGEATSLLESAARIVSGQKLYRIYAAAALLLATIPDLWLVKRHGQTELNSPQAIIDALNARQLEEDKRMGIVSGGVDSSHYYAQLGSASIRGRIVG